MDKPGTSSRDQNLMDSCAFCLIEIKDLYKCPKCDRFYCSVKCYRNEKHWICSERFYKSQVEELKPEINEDDLQRESSNQFNPETFEDYMKHFKKDQRSEKETNPQIRVRSDEEILFDSDDEPDYIRMAAEKSLEEFEKIDMGDLDRKLTMAGLGGLTDNDEQLDYLYSQLTDDEKKMFNRLADNLEYDEKGLLDSVFGKKSTAKK